MRTNLYTCLGAMRVGLNILIDQEHVKIDRLLGHGGLFKTKGVGQQILADAVNAPVSVMSTAGEGGAWGIALLAAYLVDKKDGETLDEFLDNRVFAGNEGSTLDPEPEDVYKRQGYRCRNFPFSRLRRMLFIMESRTGVAKERLRSPAGKKRMRSFLQSVIMDRE